MVRPTGFFQARLNVKETVYTRSKRSLFKYSPYHSAGVLNFFAYIFAVRFRVNTVLWCLEMEQSGIGMQSNS